MARVEADAAEIAAESQVKITELRRRAASRFIAEETKKQINMAPPTCELKDLYRDKAAGAKTRGDLIKEIDAFYNDGKNNSLPWQNALLYVNMKVGGAPQAEIDRPSSENTR